jgi:hypothetical protein
MKKLYYLIVLTLILGLVLTGCLLSNVGQVPTTPVKSSLLPPADAFTTDLLAGQTILVGTVYVWNDTTNLYVKYVITDPAEWCLTETHLAVAESLEEIPQTKKGNPIPGQFPYKHEDLGCITSDEYTISLSEIDGGVGPEDPLYIAAHAVVKEMSCYQTAILYGIERVTGTVYGIDVLTGTSWVEFDITPPPPTTSVGPNGLAYDAQNGRFYYCSYQVVPDNMLYFWDTEQHVAGQLGQNITTAGSFYDGKYYYIAGPPASDDLYEVTFNADGSIDSIAKIDDIANDAHGWTFNGDIAIKDGVVYGWGLCSSNGYEFFTYDLVTGVFNVNTVSYTSSLQIAFGSDGTLYGHRSGGVGEFYVVNTTNGGVSIVTPTPSLVHWYTDCASGMICEPVTETAWGFGLGFPGKNWATYFIYNVQ